MKKVVIVSTYPEHGTKNIGDDLITTCLTQIIQDLCEAEIQVIWRADSWDQVKDRVLSSHHVFFACLAIRPKMHVLEYPYMEKIILSDVPFSVIAAGTSLSMTGGGDLFGGFSKEALSLLHRSNQAAAVFTTRGWGTQEFCQRHGLNNAVFNGDVAFYDKKKKGRRFEKGKEIERIIISDPHMGEIYLSSLNLLHDNISSLFPDAHIRIAQHGVNESVTRFCKEKGVECLEIYKDRHNGLSVYENIDLHVGYRVHGHVCALKNRAYSYLLEQDGRGFDYGVTLDQKLSIPNYVFLKPLRTIKNSAKLLLGKPLTQEPVASRKAADEMSALIKKDLSDGFSKFVGLENQIESFNEQTFKSVEKALFQT